MINLKDGRLELVQKICDVMMAAREIALNSTVWQCAFPIEVSGLQLITNRILQPGFLVVYHSSSPSTYVHLSDGEYQVVIKLCAKDFQRTVNLSSENLTTDINAPHLQSKLLQGEVQGTRFRFNL